MKENFLTSFLNLIPDRKSFLPENLLYISLHIYYLDMHIRYVKRKLSRKPKDEKELQFSTMLSVLTPEIQTYTELYKAIKAKAYHDAMLLVKYKIGNKEERLQHYFNLARQHKQQYRVLRCTMFKRKAIGYKKAWTIIDKMGDHVECCWDNILNSK